MAKSNEAANEFLKPGLFDALKQELTQLEAIEPGSKSTAEAITELMPLIKGCRDRGHSWNRIAASFQKYLPGLTIGTLRKYAFEADPSLKGSSKSTGELTVSASTLPGLDSEEIDEDGEEEEWPPADEPINLFTSSTSRK